MYLCERCLKFSCECNRLAIEYGHDAGTDAMDRIMDAFGFGALADRQKLANALVDLIEHLIYEKTREHHED